MLSDVGLDIKKWKWNFYEALGVTTPLALHFLTTENRRLIISLKEKDWGENALMRLFDKANQLASETSSHPNDSNSQNADQTSLRKSSGTALECLSPEELVKSVSAGSALCGVYLTNDPSKIRPGHPVIRCPTPIDLISPRLEAKNETISLVSKNMHDVFKSSLTTLGISIASSIVTLSPYGFVADVGIKSRRNTKAMIEKTATDTKTYKSVSISCIRPIHAVQFNFQSMSLTEEALSELQRIETQIQECRKLEITKNRAQEFFEHFGSHINKGVLHIGGIYEHNGSFESESRKESEVTDDMVLQAVKTKMAMTVGVGPGFENKAERKQQDRLQDVDQQLQQKMHFKTVIYGGSMATTNQSEWEKSLKEKSKNLAIIDRGSDISKDFAGIWEIISNHEKQFIHPKGFTLLLKYTWYKIHGDLGDFKVSSYDQERSLKSLLLDDGIKTLQSFEAKDTSTERKKSRLIENLVERFQLCKDILGECNEFLEEAEMELIEILGKDNWKKFNKPTSAPNALLGVSKVIISLNLIASCSTTCLSSIVIGYNLLSFEIIYEIVTNNTTDEVKILTTFTLSIIPSFRTHKTDINIEL